MVGLSIDTLLLIASRARRALWLRVTLLIVLLVSDPFSLSLLFSLSFDGLRRGTNAFDLDDMVLKVTIDIPTFTFFEFLFFFTQQLLQ